MTKGDALCIEPPSNSFALVGLNHAADWWRKCGNKMANTTSAKKATRKIASRTLINTARRSRVRGFIRKLDDAVKAGDKEAAKTAFAVVEPEIMRAVSKGVIAKNTASRKVSRLSARVKAIA